MRAGLDSGRLRTPISLARLISFGVREQLDALSTVLGGHAREACLSILDAVLAERERDARPAPELVWTGPEDTQTTARDTAVILRDLFESARQRVILAGYSFRDTTEVLGPLHRSMRDHGVTATFFIDVQQVTRAVPDPDATCPRVLWCRSFSPCGASANQRLRIDLARRPVARRAAFAGQTNASRSDRSIRRGPHDVDKNPRDVGLP